MAFPTQLCVCQIARRAKIGEIVRDVAEAGAVPLAVLPEQGGPVRPKDALVAEPRPQMAGSFELVLPWQPSLRRVLHELAEHRAGVSSRDPLVADGPKLVPPPHPDHGMGCHP
jgi:hypothetical protein